MANIRYVGSNVENDHLLSRDNQYPTNHFKVCHECNSRCPAALSLVPNNPPITRHSFSARMFSTGRFMYIVLSGLKVHINPVLMPYKKPLFFFLQGNVIKVSTYQQPEVVFLCI